MHPRLLSFTRFAILTTQVRYSLPQTLDRPEYDLSMTSKTRYVPLCCLLRRQLSRNHGMLTVGTIKVRMRDLGSIFSAARWASTSARRKTTSAGQTRLSFHVTFYGPTERARKP